MIRWFSRLFRRQPRKPPRFSFWNGTRKVDADPTALGFAFLKACPLIEQINRDMAAAVADGDQFGAATLALEQLGVFRAVFGIPEDQLTALELVRLANEFRQFMSEYGQQIWQVRQDIVESM